MVAHIAKTGHNDIGITERVKALVHKVAFVFR